MSTALVVITWASSADDEELNFLINLNRFVAQHRHEIHIKLTSTFYGIIPNEKVGFYIIFMHMFFDRR